MSKGYVIRVASIFRADLRAHPEDKFVFGDNMRQRGMGGLAKEMRDEPNAMGIPTKWAPNRTPSAYFRDSDFKGEVREAISQAFTTLSVVLEEGHNVVLPVADIGSGLAQLPSKAPKILYAIMIGVVSLVDFSEKPAIVARTVPRAYEWLEQVERNGPSKFATTGNARRNVEL